MITNFEVGKNSIQVTMTPEAAATLARACKTAGVYCTSWGAEQTILALSAMAALFETATEAAIAKDSLRGREGQFNRDVAEVFAPMIRAENQVPVSVE